MTVSRGADASATWSQCSVTDNSNRKCFGVEKLKRWFNFLVDNVYLSFSKDFILRQRIGIPMGTNAAVFIANLFCFTYEYEFVTRCVNAGRVDLLSKFRYTMRYIDDLLSADNSLFEKYIYLSQVDSQGIKGIYPDFLTLNCEQEGQEVSFLDALLFRHKNVFLTKVYDKREHPPLSSIQRLRFPHVSCFLSDRSKYGIVTSRLHCFSRLCLRRSDYIYRLKIFVRDFLARGYCRSRVERTIRKFLRSMPLSFPVEKVGSLARLVTSA